MMTGRLGVALAASVGVVLGVVAAPVAGQGGGSEEVDRLQEASRAESAGDLDTAERALREVLALRTESVPALLSLERVLRIQGRLDELVPLVRAALERDPRSALLNQIMVRTYSALDRVAALEAAAAAWIETVPRIEIPYREVAAVWEGRGEYRRARSVLEEGRSRIGREEALALELGDLYAAMGEPELAVREWQLSVDERGRGLNQLRRRLGSLPDGGAGVVGQLVDLLAADTTGLGRSGAALELAVEAGLEARALELAERVLPELSPDDRRRRLSEIALQADAAGHGQLAYWAYERLLESEPADAAGARLLVFRNRMAELALELGDTARAALSYRAVEDAFAAGSPERRQAAASRIGLLARQDAGAAREALIRFREEYPGSDELDGATAAVARALLAEGRTAEAEPLLEAAPGPLSAVLRARLELERGELEAARGSYLGAAAGLRGVEATAVLSLVGLLGRISEDAGALLGDALALRDGGEVGEAVDRVSRGVERLEPGDRPPLLDFVAGLAEEAGLVTDARDVRRRIIAEHPRSQEAPSALLSLGRDLAREPGTRGEAQELLERLIIEYPRSALVPQARRVLDRLERGDMA